jgi:3-oxoacyl-[acyl-carrier-protein] synthase-1
MEPPVYLSAPAVLCGAGNNRQELLASVIAGNQQGIKPVTLSDGTKFFVGCVEDIVLRSVSDRYDGRVFRIAVAALEQLRSDVETVIKLYGASRVAVCVGSCDNGSEASLKAHKTWLSDGAFPADYDLAEQSAGYIADFIATLFGITGPAFTVSTACASSAGAIIKAAELICAGFCDAAIAGGVDIASETVLRGFDSLEAVSGEITNPFSKNRKGITLGEGAAFFIISRQDLSGAGIQLLGSGESADAFHITSPREDGSGAATAMRSALENAGITPEDVGYINLHGTGTPLNDRMESLAVASVFPRRLRLPVSSTKPVTGHTLGAAGALELAICWMVLDAVSRVDTVSWPVHCWDGVRDDALPSLCFVSSGMSAGNLRVCMSNSFAFGGCNTSLILGRE